MYMRDRDFEGSVCSGTTYTGGALHGWRVAERWGGLAGAVATVGADGRYRHLTSLDGLYRERIHTPFPHDGLGAPRRRGQGMVRRDRDWALDAIACLQHGMGDLLEIAAV